MLLVWGLFCTLWTLWTTIINTAKPGDVTEQPSVRVSHMYTENWISCTAVDWCPRISRMSDTFESIYAGICKKVSKYPHYLLCDNLRSCFILLFVMLRDSQYCRECLTGWRTQLYRCVWPAPIWYPVEKWAYACSCLHTHHKKVFIQFAKKTGCHWSCRLAVCFEVTSSMSHPSYDM